MEQKARAVVAHGRVISARLDPGAWHSAECADVDLGAYDEEIVRLIRIYKHLQTTRKIN